MILEKLTNNEILRKIQDLSDDHERKKDDIISLCKDIDNIEIEHKKAVECLSKRMSGKQ